MVQHISLGVAGLGCEPALMHLLNYVWPNVFESSPHVVQAVTGAIDGCRLALGSCVILHYLVQVSLPAPPAAGLVRAGLPCSVACCMACAVLCCAAAMLRKASTYAKRSVQLLHLGCGC